jgi:hypothetical protein
MAAITGIAKEFLGPAKRGKVRVQTYVEVASGTPS